MDYWFRLPVDLQCIFKLLTNSSSLCIVCNCTVKYYNNAKQKHLGCKKGEANQKQQLSDYNCTYKL